MARDQVQIRDEAKAETLGAADGKAAASWVFNGNTTRAEYEQFLKGYEVVDPKVMDAYAAPSLSGEWADGYSMQDLARDLGIYGADAEGSEYLDSLADVWNEAARGAFWAELERIAREQLA